MKKSVICFLGLFLFLLSSTVFATNWTYMGKDHSSAIGDYDAYIDKDTIVINGSNMVFWELDILAKTDQSGIKKYLIKTEAIISTPRQSRLLEYYDYDANDKEIYRNTTPEDFDLVTPRMNQVIDFVLQCAK